MTPKYCIIISNFIILPPLYHYSPNIPIFIIPPIHYYLPFHNFHHTPLTCTFVCPLTLCHTPPYMYVPLLFIILPLICMSPYFSSYSPLTCISPFTLPCIPPVKADLPENYSEQAWKKLKEAIKAVHHQQPISYSLEELYQAVENMSSHKMAAKLYDSLRVELEGHVTSLSPVFREEVDDFQFLVVVDKQWRDHCQQMVSCRHCTLPIPFINSTRTIQGEFLWGEGGFEGRGDV